VAKAQRRGNAKQKIASVRKKRNDGIQTEEVGHVTREFTGDHKYIKIDDRLVKMPKGYFDGAFGWVKWQLINHQLLGGFIIGVLVVLLFVSIVGFVILILLFLVLGRSKGLFIQKKAKYFGND